MAAQVLERGWTVQQLLCGAHRPASICSWDLARSPAPIHSGEYKSCHHQRQAPNAVHMQPSPERWKWPMNQARQRHARAHPVLGDRAWQKAPGRSFICKHGSGSPRVHALCHPSDRYDCSSTQAHVYLSLNIPLQAPSFCTPHLHL